MPLCGLIVASASLIGCDALRGLLGGDPPAASPNAIGLHVTIDNQSGLPADVDATYTHQGHVTRESLRHMPATGPEAVVDILWTQTDRVVLTARVGADALKLSGNDVSPGDVLAEAEFVHPQDFLGGATVVFTIPAPQPPAFIIDCNGNGIADSIDIASGFSEDCLHEPDGDDQQTVDCPPVEVVFIMDTSGSMNNEAAALCQNIAQVRNDLAANSIAVSTAFLGITQTPGGAYGCLTDSVGSLLGTAVPQAPDCCPTLGGSEDWGTATAIVAARFPWTEGYVRVIVPISDEGPRNGDSCFIEGDDAEIIAHAITIAVAHNVFVSPITASGANVCTQTLAQDLATGTGGAAFQSSDAATDLADSIRQQIVDACIQTPRCIPNGIPDECE